MDRGNEKYDNRGYWNKIYRNKCYEQPSYDNWLDKFRNILEKCKGYLIIDLGCGTGADTMYLLERGYSNIISCDNSGEALVILNKYIKGANTMEIDLSERLQFHNNIIKLIIADLSLHYFNKETTKYIISELRRVLQYDGYVICRVNSIRDINYGSGKGDTIEENYYKTKDGFKRFFNEYDIKTFFNEWNICYLGEHVMNRYGQDKYTYEIVVTK